MTDQRELDRLLGAYFVEGTNELADRVIDAALDQIDQTDQRRALRVPRRFQTMTTSTRVAVAAVIGVLAVGGAFFVTRPDRLAVGVRSPEPSASHIASAPASPSAKPSSAVVVPTSAPGWTATRGMTEARTRQTATLLLDGKVLVAGGRIGPAADGSATSAELYDPRSGTWSPTGTMHGARDGQTATRLLDGTVLVAGGGSRGGLSAMATAELYHPDTGTWTVTGDMLAPGRDHTATLLPNGKVLVAGGDFSPSGAELFDPGSGTWANTGHMITARTGHTATLLRDGRVLVAGGDQVSGPTAELYDPSTGSWAPTGNMNAERSGHTATLLPDGRVLIAGGLAPGDDHRKPLVSAELYDPISGRWTTTGNMVAVRAGGYSATLLPDGKVVVAGGYRSDGNGTLAAAELYDPASGTWAATRSMDASRANQTATLLLDGKALVSGGLSVINGMFGPLASAELFDPGGGS